MNPLEELANQILLDLYEGRLTPTQAQAALEKAGVHPMMARNMVDIAQGRGDDVIFTHE